MTKLDQQHFSRFTGKTSDNAQIQAHREPSRKET